MTLRWNLEQFKLHHQTVFVRGWLLDDRLVVAEMALQLLNDCHQERDRLQLTGSQPRPDVAERFPGRPNSMTAGFVGLGSWRCEPNGLDSIRLLVRFTNGTQQSLDVTALIGLKPGVLSRWRSHLHQLMSIGKTALSLIGRRDWPSLWHKIKLRVRNHDLKPLSQISILKNSLVVLGERCPMHLIIDHDLGGGANRSRDAQVASWLSEGATAIILSFEISSLTYVLTIQSEQKSLRYGIYDESLVLAAIGGLPIKSIVFNNAVSFKAPMHLPSLLIALKEKTGARFIFLLHDYFVICPTVYLLDNEGAFCQIPELKKCEHCLPLNHYLFSSFYRGSVREWRLSWGQLLAHADEITAFSNAAASLLRKAYPELRELAAVQIKPHLLDLPRDPPIEAISISSAVIGVVGQIGVHKGCHVVRDLADQIRIERGSERIVVIGSLECHADPTIVTQTGRYPRHELRERISRSGINIILFPSVWPETFSFVCAEICQTGLPILCFDLGAQAEWIYSYPRGKLLSVRDSAQVLLELRSFFDFIYKL